MLLPLSPPQVSFHNYFLSTSIAYTYFFFFLILFFSLVSCICVSIELSTVVLSAFFEVCRLYGGFFTSPRQLLDSMQWKFLDVLSYIKYAFVGIALNELHGLELTCTSAEIAANQCKIFDGETIIVDKGYDEYTIPQVAGALVGYIIVARILGYLGLRFIKV